VPLSVSKKDNWDQDVSSHKLNSRPLSLWSWNNPEVEGTCYFSGGSWKKSGGQPSEKPPVTWPAGMSFYHWGMFLQEKYWNPSLSTQHRALGTEKFIYENIWGQLMKEIYTTYHAHKKGFLSQSFCDYCTPSNLHYQVI
jgi:hypothetical protein